MLNGRLSPGVLRPIPGGRLRKDAALRWNAMCAHQTARHRRVPMPNGPMSSYRTFAQQVYLKAYWTRLGKPQNAATPGRSNHGLGIAVDTNDSEVCDANPRFGFHKRHSDAPWECVPLDTRILTRRGLVGCDELLPGDETVGYNPATGRTEWTAIVDARIVRDAEVVRYEHSTVTVRCTENHRWLLAGRPAAPRTAFGTLAEAVTRDPQGRVLLAASGAEGEGLPITAAEAALIGWAMTDGSIYRFATRRGKRAFARVYQRKAVGVGAVDELMAEFPHVRQPNYNGGQCVAWYVARDTFTPILHRSRLDELGPVRFVLTMNSEQRAAFLGAVQMADGEQGVSMRRIAQSEDVNREAIAVAAALEGHLVALRPKTVNLKRPVVRVGNLARSAITHEDVWCPTTLLGTWTAEQDGQVFLTGNSWHRKWGGGGSTSGGQSYGYMLVTIRKGSKRSASIKHLQVLLRGAGYLRSSWRAHTAYTLTVRRAVRKFQKDHHLHVDGVVGPVTWKAIRRAYDRRRKH